MAGHRADYFCRRGLCHGVVPRLGAFFESQRYRADYAAIGIFPILKEAFEAILERRMTMELSMTIAIVAAVAIGQFFTGLVIILFVLIAEVLEGMTVARGRSAIQDLLDFLPANATVRRNGGPREIAARELRLGDVVVVKPGSRIAVDGEVIGGNSFVDQSSITGESLPVEKLAGTHVYAGTINQSCVLEIRTTGIGRDTAFGKIIDAVEKAEKTRAPIQRTADRLAGYLVYFALGCAALTFLITRDLRSTISVIIVAGACGIAAGTPLAILGGIGTAARAGAIIKGGLHLEVLSRVDTVVLDKTGTLTYGNPEVTNIRAADRTEVDEVLQAAAIAERPSEHPLARAILKKASERSLPLIEPDSFNYLPGKGLRCSIDGEEIIVGNQALLAEKRIEPYWLGIGSSLPRSTQREREPKSGPAKDSKQDCHFGSPYGEENCRGVIVVGRHFYDKPVSGTRTCADLAYGPHLPPDHRLKHSVQACSHVDW